MFRYLIPKSLSAIALYAGLAIGLAAVRSVSAAPDDIVDPNGDTHHNPPASTTDKSPAPPEGVDNASTTAKPRSKEDRDSRDAVKQEAAAEKLKLRAGERVGSDARGAALVLGMSLQEAPHDRVKVVDVAMNSPAFDAGVMKGDEIVAFQGFRGETYRKWIDGIRRLTTDTAAGLKIPVVLSREGKQLTVGIEMREIPARTAPARPLAQPGSPIIPPAVGPAVPAQGGAVAVAGGNNNVAIENGAPFGEFFGGRAASPNERAVAHLVRIGGQAAPAAPPASEPTTPATNQSPPQNSLAPPTAAPIGGGMRIGMAGFRDDPGGMVVMVDVGALAPGNYIVGIADPSVIGGAAVTAPAAVNPNVQSPAQQPAQSTGQQAAPVAQPAGTNVPVDAANPNTNPPSRVAKNDGTSGVTLNQIGTVTVDQSGTGRMQQKVETVQVRTVVGQALVLYSTREAQTTNNPPNATTQPNSQAVLAPPAGAGPQVPVAGGIIQLVSDRRPTQSTVPQAAQPPVPANGAVEQPANATPEAGQNLVR